MGYIFTGRKAILQTWTAGRPVVNCEVGIFQERREIWYCSKFQNLQQFQTLIELVIELEP